jgi:hypothetical protein
MALFVALLSYDSNTRVAYLNVNFACFVYLLS